MSRRDGPRFSDVTGRHSDRGVRDRQDAHITGSDFRPREGQTIYGTRDGSASARNQNGKGMLPDAPASSGIPDRWCSKRRRFEWLRRCEQIRLRNGRITREGLKTTLSDLRLRKQHRSARARWNSICDCPAVFIVGRDRAKLSYHWRHAFQTPQAGRLMARSSTPIPAGLCLQGRISCEGRTSARRSTVNSCWPRSNLVWRRGGGLSSLRYGRPIERRSDGVRRWISSGGTSPRHSAPPRYVSEKLVRDVIDSAFDGDTQRAVAETASTQFFAQNRALRLEQLDSCRTT
jgi:hypothetical protein